MVERRQSTLLYWATEREAIRLRKEQHTPIHKNDGEDPWDDPCWTRDPFLAKYRFCNVRRKDDRVSQWLIKNVLCRYQLYTPMTFVKLVSLCRWINWPPTIDTIQMSPWVNRNALGLTPIGDIIEQQIGKGVKAWTGAYMVRAPSKKKYPGVSKGAFVSEVVVGALDKHLVSVEDALKVNSAQGMWEVLCSVPNWGSFMAGQVVADLTYTPLLGKAYDLYTWAPQGPGSRRGFNRLLGRPLKAKIDDEYWSEQLQYWREQLVGATGLKDMTLHDVQNCLCEVDKYIRVKNGEGRPRSTYTPETAF